MKKLLAIAVMLTALATSQSFAGGSASANVNLTVNAPLVVTKVNDLNFGAGLPGDLMTVNDVTSSNAAYFTIAGSASTPVTMTVTPSGNLVGSSGNIPWTVTFAYDNHVTPSQSTATDVAGGGPYTYSTNSSGVLGVWLGGSVSIPAATVAGQYSATVQLSVVY
jgi:hypothetical protein